MMKSASESIVVLFGLNVRRLRQQLGLSQEGLGVKAGLHRTYIGAVERGEKSVTIVTAAKIADALEVHVADLLEPHA